VIGVKTQSYDLVCFGLKLIIAFFKSYVLKNEKAAGDPDSEAQDVQYSIALTLNQVPQSEF
jgi:hypothetical protein